MIGIAAQEVLKARFTFAVGLRLEIFYALRSLMDPRSRIHAEWKERSLASLPPSFHDYVDEIGGTAEVWTMCADAVSEQRIDMTLGEIVADLEGQEVTEFQRRVLLGAVHFPDMVDALVSGEITLRDAIAAAPAEKREWYAYIGMFPYDEDAPMIVALERLLAAPKVFRNAVCRTVEVFWESVFESAWERTTDELQRSLQEKERLFDSCTFAEFAQLALLRIDVDTEGRRLVAIRGGAELPFDQIREGYIVPSMFNDRRYWTTDTNAGPEAESVVYLPYFDPTLSPAPSAGVAKGTTVVPELEPVLLFKALGDTTRFALAGRIARRPMTATELARELSVSKPTISHHLTILRESGLISEEYLGGSVALSLRRDIIEQLSPIGLSHLFGEPGDNRRTS